jgi:translation elongation factor EF-Tu-like GTPase
MFRMTVEDVFSIRGRGTVATGKVELGPLRKGDEVRINDETLRVDGIEAFRKLIEEANAGDNVGLLFSKLKKDKIQRGDVITGIDY